MELRNTELYEQDFVQWIQETARLLRDGKFHELDIQNLVDEIESMGRSERHALTSNLAIVLLHLLKYKYQPTHRSNSWLASILEHRLRLEQQLSESPSLKPYLEQVFDKSYRNGRLRAAVETGLPLTTFPTESPFTLEAALDIDYLPD